jgi:hypothetical protein
VKRNCEQVVYTCHAWYIFHVIAVMVDKINFHRLYSFVTSSLLFLLPLSYGFSSFDIGRYDTD